MTDYILQKDLPSSYEATNESIKFKYRNNESISTINFFEFDIVTDTLKHIHSGSKIRKFLSSFLANFYSCINNYIFIFNWYIISGRSHDSYIF